MKKVTLFAIFLLLAVAISACAASPSENVQQATYLMETLSSLRETVNEDQNTSIEPPKVLVFNSLTEYQKFSSSVEMTDDEFVKYLQENSYDMNGIVSKENVQDTVSLVEEISFPEISGYKLSQFIIYPDWHECYLLYMNSESQRCSFLYQLDNTAAIQNYINHNSRTAPLDLENYAEIQTLYELSITDTCRSGTSEEINSYYAMIDNIYVLIRTFGISRDTISSFVSDLSFVNGEEVSLIE